MARAPRCTRSPLPRAPVFPSVRWAALGPGSPSPGAVGRALAGPPGGRVAPETTLGQRPPRCRVSGAGAGRAGLQTPGLWGPPHPRPAASPHSRGPPHGGGAGAPGRRVSRRGGGGWGPGKGQGWRLWSHAGHFLPTTQSCPDTNSDSQPEAGGAPVPEMRERESGEAKRLSQDHTASLG